MSEFAFNFGILFLRVGFGAIMIIHGFQKVKIILSGGAEKWLNPIGIGPVASLYLSTFAELVCAVMVILGIFTRTSSLILAFTMFVAAFVFLKNSAWAGKELATLFFVGFVALLFLGGGNFSISNLLFDEGSLLRKL